MKNSFRFILVDDDPFALKVGEQIIRYYRRYAETKTFTTVLDALEYLDLESQLSGNKKPTVLLTDLHMPCSDGFELLDRIECCCRTIRDQLHIFVVSAAACPDEIKRVLSYKCVIGYLPKPLSIHKMAKILKCIEYPL
jgi:CheY-like chemotaxis protein